MILGRLTKDRAIRESGHRSLSFSIWAASIEPSQRLALSLASALEIRYASTDTAIGGRPGPRRSPLYFIGIHYSSDTLD